MQRNHLHQRWLLCPCQVAFTFVHSDDISTFITVAREQEKNTTNLAIEENEGSREGDDIGLEQLTQQYPMKAHYNQASLWSYSKVTDFIIIYHPKVTFFWPINQDFQCLGYWQSLGFIFRRLWLRYKSCQLASSYSFFYGASYFHMKREKWSKES